MPDGLITAETCRNVLYRTVDCYQYACDCSSSPVFFNFCFTVTTVANVIIFVVNIYRDVSQFFPVAFEPQTLARRVADGSASWDNFGEGLTGLGRLRRDFAVRESVRRTRVSNV
jgi:hypothetical protein